MRPQFYPTSSGPPASDAELSARVRSGDRQAFGELWERHVGSASIVARQFRGIADPQDILQEASRRVLSAMVRGGGPFGNFRPYMNQTVRNVAVSWSRERVADPVGDVHEFAIQSIGMEAPDYADGALERMITVRAFKSLPQRWQTVLWYTYIEGMGSDEVADHLALSRNAAAVLIGRAREGLRQAWLKAHLSDEALPAECRWVVDELPAWERGEATERNSERVERHLSQCARCSIVAAEVNDLGARLPIILLPLLVAGFDVLTASVEELLDYQPVDPITGTPYPADATSAVTASRSATAGGPAVVRVVTQRRVWIPAAIAISAMVVAIAALNLGGAEGLPVPDAGLSRPPAAGYSPRATPSASPVPSAEPSPSPSVLTSPSPSPTPRPSPEARASGRPAGESAADVQAPAPPRPAGPPSVTGAPTPGALVWIDAFAFSGTGQPGATVEVLSDGAVIGQTAVGAGGQWSIAPPPPSAGPLTISARQTGGDGVASQAAMIGTYTFERPVSNSIGSLGSGLLTVGVNGVAGRQVQIRVDGVDKGTQVLNGAGQATFPPIQVATGQRVVTIRYVEGSRVGLTAGYPVTVQ